MIRMRAAVLVAGLLVLTSARSDAWLIQSGGPLYVGLGDLYTYTMYWGVQAYSRAYSIAGGQSMNVIRASDGATCDFVYSGATGVNLITASCAGGGTNGQSPATFCNGTTCKIVTLYNQAAIANSATPCTGSTTCDLTQATGANQFTLDFSGSCTKTPFCPKITTGLSMATPSYTPPSAISTLNVVYERTSGSSTQNLLATGNTRNILRAAGTGAAAMLVDNASTTCTSPCAPESAFHSAILTIDGANTTLQIESSATTNRAGSVTGSAIAIGSAANTVYWMEGSYIASVGQDATARTAVIANQHTRWAF